MQEPSIFTRIIKGEIPCHKIYEDDTSFAFLDINPVQPGHVLVVSKLQIDRLEDLPDDIYVAFLTSLKNIMHRVVEVYGPEYRACIKVEGFDVPHAHVHIIPCRTAAEFAAAPGTGKRSEAEMAEIAKKLAF